MEFFALAAPRSESELSVMECMLIAHDIPHYVHNRSFGGLYPGLQIPLYNVRKVMVPLAYAEEAINLFRVFREELNDAFSIEKLSWGDRARVTAEIILGGWTLPIKQRKYSPSDETQ